jgi:hypothetical protein
MSSSGPVQRDNSSSSGLVSNVLRLVMLLLVLAVGFVVFQNWTVHSAYEKSKSAVEAVMPRGEVDDPAKGLYLDKVPSLLTGNVERHTDPANPKTVIFEWKSIVRTYHLSVKHADDGFVERAEWY